MKILFDGSAVLNSNSGIATYADELFYELKKKLNDQIIFYPKISPKKNTRSSINKFKKQILPTLRKIPHIYILKNKFDNLKFYKQSKDFQLYHETNFILKPFDGKKILTVHDLTFLKNPEFHPYNRVKFMEKNFLKSINSANQTITDSEYVKNDIIKIFGINSKIINPIHLAPSRHFKENLQIEYIDSYLSKYNIYRDKFLLFVGSIEPRKNLINLIKAFKKTKDKKFNQYKLVLAGNLGWKYEEILKSIDNNKDVVFIKSPTNEHLNILLHSQFANVLVSFSEGFGLPIVETMRFAKPIICSNNSSMKEIGGKCAILVDPNDVEQISDKIYEIIHNKEYVDELKAKSKYQSNFFSWEKAAQQTIEVYEK